MSDIALSNTLRTGLEQTQALAPQQQQGLRLLAMNLPELRQEILREMACNPVIDDVKSALEVTTVTEARERKERQSEAEPDFPDDYDPKVESARALTHDSEAADRRQRFFDNQRQEETLEEHLLAQIPLSDIPPADLTLAEMVVGDLNDDGLFIGSVPDIAMVTGETEEKVLATLAKITELDPLGCGARTVRESLLAQLLVLDGSPYQEEVRALIERHLEDIANNRLSVIEGDLGIDRARYVEVLKALRTLNPRPGRAYRKAVRRSDYINPEVHAVRGPNGWIARVDDRSLPEIHVSEKYLAMLKDKSVSAETKAYVRERLEAVNNLQTAIDNRQNTVTAIAQAIFDAQPDFFTCGLKGLRPLGMQEIADRVGVHLSTVSRTVNDKYASTCKGVVELRKFFTRGYVTAAGAVSKEAVMDALKGLIASEDADAPYSDQQLADLLQARKFPVHRRTVTKYRQAMGLLSARERHLPHAGGLQ